jgi:hypothetical protein
MFITNEAQSYIRDKNLSLTRISLSCKFDSIDLNVRKYLVNKNVVIVNFHEKSNEFRRLKRIQLIVERNDITDKYKIDKIKRYIGSEIDDGFIEPFYGYVVRKINDDTYIWMKMINDFLCRYTFDNRFMSTCNCCLHVMKRNPRFVCKECESIYCDECVKFISNNQCNCGVDVPIIKILSFDQDDDLCIKSFISENEISLLKIKYLN